MYAATTEPVTEARMNEAELKEWVEQKRRYQQCGGTTIYNKQVVDVAALLKLFAGKNLVDAEAVVLSVEDAERIKKATDQPSARATMHAAIELARGKNGN